MSSPNKMLAEILQRDLHSFVHRSFLELNGDKTFRPNWHLDVLCEKLQQVAEGKCRRLIINIPPRHLKSHTASIAFPAWLLGRDPTKQILCVSYAQDLSDKMARECRKLMQSTFYRGVFPTRISDERQAVADFETTEGGNRFSTSVGGVMTGRGADIIIVDDPIKADDAASDVRRESVNEWYDNSLRSRLNNQETGAIIIVMQRLHANDLVGHVLESEGWDAVKFPAIAKEDVEYRVNTPFGFRIIQRRESEILQPDLVSEVTLNQLQHTMTSYNFAAQYQQDPQPPEGLIIQRDWLKFYKDSERPESFEQIVQSWDTANKATELADYSVGTTWGIVGNRLYLLHVLRRRMEFPELKRTVLDAARGWKADLVLVEDKASGTQLIQELRAEGFSRVRAAPKQDGDKVMRTRIQTARIEGGFMLLPTDAPWLDTYVRELISFPNCKYDDQVDSTVNMLAWGTEHAARPLGWFDVARSSGPDQALQHRMGLFRRGWDF